MTTSQLLRQQFLDYFRNKGHQILPGISLVPTDPSLLLTGAGVVPFRDFIEGRAKPLSPRVATCQKCVRDNDTERVGRTARHLTFFEMLGNFSFGDYYKRETILWGWDFLTNIAKLDGARLSAAVYLQDEDAAAIWESEVGLPRERIVPLGKNDNWWGPLAETGACGPCSEVYIDLGPQIGCRNPDCRPGCDCDRYLEIWNFVFTEYYMHKDGSVSSLPTKNIDTGLGLERLAVPVQGKTSCFETDLLFPLVALAREIASEHLPSAADHEPESDAALRVIADHARSFTFMIGDGILPSNEGRGYVLRRLMRRAVTQGRKLGVHGKFLALLVPKVVELMAPTYPELLSLSEHVARVADAEEERFRETLEAGWQRLEEHIQTAKAQGQTVLEGEQVFRLHDTYGFPFHLTREFAEQAGLKVDEDGFRRTMEVQRQASLHARGRDHGGQRIYADVLQEIGLTSFLGYDSLAAKAKVMALLSGGERAKASSLDNLEIVLDQTPFYPESGGQVGDTGRLEGESCKADVLETFYGAEGLIVHSCRLLKGEFHEGDILEAKVDAARRAALQRSHTATHLLHYALRNLLGHHVAQSGSLVQPDSFRFDFSHFGSPSPQQIEEIEAMVNERILEDSPVVTQVMTLDKARASGAIALFGEKYGSLARVVQVADFSKELCGGTHVSSTGQIGCLRLLSEGSIGAGLRRLTALTGHAARRAWIDDENRWKGLVELVQASSKDEVAAKIVALTDSLQSVTAELERYRSATAAQLADSLASHALSAGPFRLVIENLETVDHRFLEQLCDQVSEKTAPSLVLLAARAGASLPLVCKLSPELTQHGLHAGKIVAQVAGAAGGKGGGRPLFATGAARDASRLLPALADLRARLQEELKV